MRGLGKRRRGGGWPRGPTDGRLGRRRWGGPRHGGCRGSAGRSRRGPRLRRSRGSGQRWRRRLHAAGSEGRLGELWRRGLRLGAGRGCGRRKSRRFRLGRGRGFGWSGSRSTGLLDGTSGAAGAGRVGRGLLGRRRKWRRGCGGGPRGLRTDAESGTGGLPNTARHRGWGWDVDGWVPFASGVRKGFQGGEQIVWFEIEHPQLPTDVCQIATASRQGRGLSRWRRSFTTSRLVVGTRFGVGGAFFAHRTDRPSLWRSSR
jgi:hypothetical protein